MHESVVHRAGDAVRLIYNVGVSVACHISIERAPMRRQSETVRGSDFIISASACRDGKGGGISQAGNPAASRLAGKCVARETLALLRGALTPAAFRRVTWDNAHRIYGLSAG